MDTDIRIAQQSDGSDYRDASRCIRRPHPNMSIEVDDVDTAHTKAAELGLEVVMRNGEKRDGTTLHSTNT